MTKRKILAKLVLAIVFATIVSALKIHPTHFSYLPIQKLKSHLMHTLQYRISHDPTDGVHKAIIPEAVFSGLKDSVANDTLIMNRIHADKPLSKVSAEKIKSYFLGSE